MFIGLPRPKPATTDGRIADHVQPAVAARACRRSAALSHSATTRLVTRLEKRGLLSRYLCDDDRRGIYSTLTEQGKELLEGARPVHDATLKQTLDAACEAPELAPLIEALHALPRS